MTAAEAGITYPAFLMMGPAEMKAVAMGNQRRENRLAWLFGAYVMRAVCAAIAPLVTKKGREPYKYPSRPDQALAPKTETELQAEIDAETMRARAYMMQMEMAGKDWGKR